MFVGRDIVSISDLTKSEIEQILQCAQEMSKKPAKLCKNALLASCFFEPSTRTRLSFEAAMHRLGGSVIGFSDIATTSMQKGETLSDSIQVISSYCDLIVIRHPMEGSARLAAEASDKPVINAGDGANQHPTQTLVDLFAIQQCQGKIDDLHIALAGDLKFGRTVHSLALALAHYSVHLYFVFPELYPLPEDIAQELRKKGVQCSFHTRLAEVLPKVDILYMTRIQKERCPNGPNRLPNPCRLQQQDLKSGKHTLKILHPLPRVDEIDKEIDNTPFAFYFQQAAGALPVRMALLALLLGER